MSKKEHNTIKTTNKLMIISIILLIILIVVVSSFAWQTWSSKEDSNSVNLKIKNLVEVLFNNGAEINIDNLEPVLSYEEGALTTFSMKKITSNDVGVSVSLDFASIDDELKNESLKYILMYSNDNINYISIATGSFENATDTLSIIENYVVSDKLSYYKLYIYIDANLPNPGEMQETSFEGILNISASKIE